MPSSLTMLLPPASGSSPCLPVSVSGTGPWAAIAAFPGGGRAALRYSRLRSFRGSASAPGNSPRRRLRLPRGSPYAPLAPYPRVPACSVPTGRGTLGPPPLACASRPRLRSRLPQGRSALPWKPQASGLDGSHVHLATRSGILSPHASTVARAPASPACRRSPTSARFPARSMASVRRLSPVYFRRAASRLVSCYALFQ